MIKLTFGHFKSSAMNFAMAAEEIAKGHCKVGGFLSRILIRCFGEGEYVVRSQQVHLATVHESIVNWPVERLAVLLRVALNVELVGTLLAHPVIIVDNIWNG